MAQGEDQKALQEAKKTPRTRAEAAMSLVISGASFAEAAQILEYASPQAARMAVESALASQSTLTEKAQLRQVQSQRYERLLRSVMPRATNPRDTQHLAYNARANALIDRISKLHGLDAPTQVQISPSDEYLAAYAEKMKQSLGLESGIVEEADILDEADEQIGDE